MSTAQKVIIGATLNADGSLSFEEVTANSVKNLTQQAVTKAIGEIQRGSDAAGEIAKRAALDLYLGHENSKTWKAAMADIEANRNSEKDSKVKMENLTKLYPPKFAASINPATGKAIPGTRKACFSKLNSQLYAAAVWIDQHSLADLQKLSADAMKDSKLESQEVNANWLEKITTIAGKSSTWKALGDTTITKAYSAVKGHAAGKEPEANPRMIAQYKGICDTIGGCKTYREALEAIEQAFYDAAVEVGFEGKACDMSHLVD